MVCVILSIICLILLMAVIFLGTKREYQQPWAGWIEHVCLAAAVVLSSTPPPFPLASSPNRITRLPRTRVNCSSFDLQQANLPGTLQHSL